MDSIIVWFRNDLRIQDNPALMEASKTRLPLIPLYILDEESEGIRKMGAASKVWLNHALIALNKDLKGNLLLMKGPAQECLQTLIKVTSSKGVFWNRCYEPASIERDKKIKSYLQKNDIQAKSFNGSLLWEPMETLKADGTPYRVFTPFYKNAISALPPPRTPLGAPQNLKFHDGKNFEKALQNLSFEELSLLPKDKNWHEKLIKSWNVSERGAHQRFEQFLDEGLPVYKNGRNFPSKPYVSRLSPYLHFGQISPHQLWEKVEKFTSQKDIAASTASFQNELGWREFSTYLLYHFPKLPTENFQKNFDKFPWQNNTNYLKAWQKGQTGYPIIDAGMRELWKTGYMHNRVRMIVGSFLVKNLLLHWKEGEAWFWDCLFDADLANNTTSWQWVSGAGVDAAPYFRIFNPVTQSEKFDKDGDYIRTYLPELSHLPNNHIHTPWMAPEAALSKAGVNLGVDYPHPIVDLKTSRQIALDAYQQIKKT